MGINKLKVVLTEEAQAFLDAQPFKAQQKIYYTPFGTLRKRLWLLPHMA